VDKIRIETIGHTVPDTGKLFDDSDYPHYGRVQKTPSEELSNLRKFVLHQRGEPSWAQVYPSFDHLDPDEEFGGSDGRLEHGTADGSKRSVAPWGAVSRRGIHCHQPGNGQPGGCALLQQEGTAEQWIKESKQAVKTTQLSCHRFGSDQVPLWLSVLGYNLGNLWRRLMLPSRIDNGSPTRLQQRLEKTGGRLVKRARKSSDTPAVWRYGVSELPQPAG
jgi:hypothetical protein